MERLNTARLLTAIKTPYTQSGKLDIKAFDQLVEKQVASGVEGLVVGGTTGEGHLMSWDEHLMLIAHAVNFFGDRIIIIGNTGSNNTREAMHATEQGFAIGMHAALQINPYYGRTSKAGLEAHFGKLLDLGPALIYNVPGRTGQDIEPEVMEELAKHQNFIGVKECAGPERIAAYAKKGIRSWSGNDNECFESRHRYGAQGVISVASNLFPGLMRQLMDEDNPDLNKKLTPMMDWLFSEPNPIPLNTALAMTGAALPTFRLPYAPLGAEEREQGLAMMQEIGLSHLVGDRLEVMNDSDFTLI